VYSTTFCFDQNQRLCRYFLLFADVSAGSYMSGADGFAFMGRVSLHSTRESAVFAIMAGSLSMHPHVRPHPNVHLSNMLVYATTVSSHTRIHAIQLPKDPPARHDLQ